MHVCMCVILPWNGVRSRHALARLLLVYMINQIHVCNVYVARVCMYRIYAYMYI